MVVGLLRGGVVRIVHGLRAVVISCTDAANTVMMLGCAENGSWKTKIRKLQQLRGRSTLYPTRQLKIWALYHSHRVGVSSFDARSFPLQWPQAQKKPTKWAGSGSAMSILDPGNRLLSPSAYPSTLQELVFRRTARMRTSYVAADRLRCQLALSAAHLE
jgi:hypothetical protein